MVAKIVIRKCIIIITSAFYDALCMGRYSLEHKRFYAFALSIGMGYLVIHSPKVIEDFWSSVGLTKTGGRGLRSLASMISKKTRWSWWLRI